MASFTAIPAVATTLWVSSLFNTANRAAVIKEALSIGGLCVFSFRREIVSTTSLSWTVAVAVLSSALCLYVGVSYVCFKRSKFLETRLLGETRLCTEPVFFRCKTYHTRLFPRKHSFVYSILEVGIPLSFHGTIGRLFSFDNGYNSEAKSKNWSLFSVDSRDYLRRGNETLEEKMKAFLEENNMNLDDYPTVYLVTEPRFLGYQFNPVSFWYLRDKDSILSLVVVEVNNTFDERHMYILRPSRPLPDSTTPLSEGKPVSISNSFPKTFHVSPFNDRTGKYHILTHDPLSSHEDSKNLINTITTLYDDTDNKKLIAAVRSVAPPIFISDLSTSIMGSFLFVAKYGWSGLITFPRIVWQASKLFGVKKLKVYFRPEVKGTSISRNATTLELQLERYFRKYLQSRVKDYPHPIMVHYSSAGIGGPPQKETFQSTSTSESATLATAMEVDITVFSPCFYVSWVLSQSMQQTLILEMLSKPEEKRSVEVSNLELAISLLDSIEKENVAESSNQECFDKKLTWRLISGMRRWFSSHQKITAKTAEHIGKFGERAGPLTPRSDSPSLIDRRILLLPDMNPIAYRECIIQAMLTETIGLGDGMLLRLCDIIIRGTLVYIAWQGFVGVEVLKPWGAIGGLVVWQILKGVF